MNPYGFILIFAQARDLIFPEHYQGPSFPVSGFVVSLNETLCGDRFDSNEYHLHRVINKSCGYVSLPTFKEDGDVQLCTLYRSWSATNLATTPTCSS